MGGREVSRPYRDWFFAEGERSISFRRCHRPRWRGRRWWCGVADSSLSLEPQTKGTVLSNQRDGSFGLPLAYTNQKNRPFGLWFMLFCLKSAMPPTSTGAKHWHRLKAVFYIFVLIPPCNFLLNWENRWKTVGFGAIKWTDFRRINNFYLSL